MSLQKKRSIVISELPASSFQFQFISLSKSRIRVLYGRKSGGKSGGKSGEKSEKNHNFDTQSLEEARWRLCSKLSGS